MAGKRKRGEIVDLETRRARRTGEALADASRSMLRAEEALFELLRDVGREDQRKVTEARPADKAKGLNETRDLPAVPAQDGVRPPAEPARGRVIPFRRVRAA